MEKKSQVPDNRRFSKTLNALSEAHAVHNDHAAAGLEKGIESETQQQQMQQPPAPADGQQQAAAGPPSG